MSQIITPPQPRPGWGWKPPPGFWAILQWIIVILWIVSLLGIGYYLYTIMFSYKPIDATFILEQSVFQALPPATRQKLDAGKVQIEEPKAVNNDGGGGGGSSNAFCLIKTVVSVATAGLICEIASAFVSKVGVSNNTIVIDATK